MSLGKRDRGIVSSAMAMQLESAALFTVFEVQFEITYATASPLVGLFLTALDQIGVRADCDSSICSVLKDSYL